MVELPRAEIRPAGGALDGQTAGGRDDELLHGRILDSMTCGVMLIDAGGVITAFNAAAAELLGLDRRSVVGRVFAEVFLSNETFDDFSEAVLRAVYDGSVGDQQVINVPREARSVPLAVSTSCLRDACGGERTDPGVVAVFSDISELEELRARQIELARDLESKHEELKEAYRSLEGRNRRLDALVRRVKAARTVAAVFVIALGVGIGVFAWRGSPAGWIDKSPAPSGQPMETRSFVTVEPSRIVSTITVATEIDPRREVAVTSPVRGTVAAVHVQHGETVHAGRPLLDIDVTEVRIERRTAMVAYLKAKARVEELANWANSVDASRARRAVTKARIAFESGKARLAQTDFLVEQGLVPAARRDAAEREQRSLRLDLEAAEQDLDAVLASAQESHEVARLELANAAERLKGLDAILRSSTVVAPVAGVVLYRGRRSPNGGGPLATGTSIEPGQYLLTIGDVEGISATGRIDEIDVGQIRRGQRVRIAGPAFPGVVLAGTITHVSSQASRPGGQGLPSFEVAAAVEKLTEEQRDAVRLGMSADMEIVVYENDDALVIPISAVDLSAGGPRVGVRDAASGAVRTVDVTTGVTTIDAVEIRSGIAPGDQVLVP